MRTLPDKENGWQEGRSRLVFSEQLRERLRTPKEHVENMAKNRTYFTLSQAAKESGKSKSVLSKALKNGTLSYVTKDSSGYQIDPAELFRVYPKQEQENDPKERSRTAENAAKNDLENALRISQLEGENKLLGERLQDRDERIGELKEERDRWRDQANQLLLTHQPSPESPEDAPENITSEKEIPQPTAQSIPLLWGVIGLLIVILGFFIAIQWNGWQ